MNTRASAGDAYDAELIGALREGVFDREDPDAVDAVKAAAKQVPPFGVPARRELAEREERP